MTDGRSARAEHSRQQRRQQILDTALEVFAAQGYDRTSITDLVSAAGVARGTFYLYFDSKQAIFAELLDGLLAQLRGSVGGVEPSGGPASIEAQLQAIVVRVLRTAQANKPLARIIFRVAVGVNDELDAQLHAFYGNLRAFIAHSLRLGQAVGFIQAGVDAEIAATCVLGSLRAIVEQHIVERDTPARLDVLAAAVLATHLEGLRA